jgi:hypothetical protein
LAAKIIKYNIKLMISNNALAAAIFATASLLLFGIAEMEYRDIGRMAEMYLCFVGMLMFAQVANFEATKNSWQQVCSKPTPYSFLCLVRIVIAAVLCSLIMLAPLSLLYALSESVAFPQGFAGFSATAWIFGMIGLVAAELSNSAKFGCLNSLSVYFLMIFMQERLGAFQIFKVSYGMEWRPLDGILALSLLGCLYLAIVKLKSSRTLGENAS